MLKKANLYFRKRNLNKEYNVIVLINIEIEK